ncbi:PI31 proteasome regulator N-terminal-domain-containing protein [Schizophyllum amplum]|uniref:PI31 proteasome regulator N-terminal-domain-containing protein n=1 Tax=Schizophyllum amplum TaxID=97359 RepID=A0A550CT18_9AGAR|nr:PI31 proteasome regulator N-terminal-domain-containing protein [Auriculariopsis ampla]
MSSQDILVASALLVSVSALLPEPKRLECPQDAIAALIHAAFTTLSFRLVGVDDTSSTTTYEGNVLPEGWNRNGPGHYTLRYRHEQSSMQFVIKVSKLGGRTVINAIAVETDKTATLDLGTKDYTSESFFPYSVDSPVRLGDGYISSSRIQDFIGSLKTMIIQRLVPGLQKEGYIESEPASSSSAAQPPAGPAEPQPRIPPDGGAPHPDPHAPQLSERDSLRMPSRNPLEIGRRDLDPIPRNPWEPPSLFPDHGGDGMMVGPNHPIFGDRRGGPVRGIDPFGQGGMGGQRGPWGGDGFLPPMGAPPGARFDPVGPSFGGGMGGFPRAPRRGGDPDNDEFMPPGVGDMFM